MFENFMRVSVRFAKMIHIFMNIGEYTPAYLW